MTSKEKQDEVLTWEQFVAKELKEFELWVSKRPRSRRQWLFAMERFAIGDR